MSSVAALARRLFPSAPATRLGAVRIATAAFTLWSMRRRYRMLMRIASENDRKLFAPVGVARTMERPPPPRLVQAAVLANIAATGAVVVGWRHRWTGPLSSALLLWVLSYRNSWSMIYHSENLLVLHTMILGVAPAADALSIDARRGRATLAADPSGDWRYGWPLQLMSTTTALAYALSGVAKLAGPMGWKWTGGQTLRRQVAVDGLRKILVTKGSPVRLPEAVTRNDALWKSMAVGTMVIELGAPAFLSSRRLGKLWALAALTMHYGVFGVMRINFRYQMSGVAFASFFDLERTGSVARRVARYLWPAP